MLLFISLLKTWRFLVAESEMRKRGRQVYFGDSCPAYTLLRLSLPSLKSVRGFRAAVPIRITGGIFATSDAWALSQGILSLPAWKSQGIGRISKGSLMILMCSQG